MAQEAVEDADPAVEQGAQCLVMGVVGCTATVVEGSGFRRAGERADRPPRDRIGEMVVAVEPGEHDAVLARRFGDR